MTRPHSHSHSHPHSDSHSHSQSNPTSPGPYRIVIVEDEPLIAEDLADLCTGWGYQVCGIAHTSKKAFAMIQECRPGLVLLDVNLGEQTDGIHIAQWIKENHGIPFIFITSYVDGETIDRAKQTSPLGYIVKPFRNEQIYSTIEIAMSQAAHYKPREFDTGLINRRTAEPISDREADVLRCLYQGMDTRGIAQSLFVSVNTVKFHLKNLYGKFGVHNRVELVRKLHDLMAG